MNWVKNSQIYIYPPHIIFIFIRVESFKYMYVKVIRLVTKKSDMGTNFNIVGLLQNYHIIHEVSNKIILRIQQPNHTLLFY